MLQQGSKHNLGLVASHPYRRPKLRRSSYILPPARWQKTCLQPLQVRGTDLRAIVGKCCLAMSHAYSSERGTAHRMQDEQACI